MKNSAIIITFFMSVLGTVQYSCNDCHTKHEGLYELTGADLQMVPYIGNETLIFKNLTGDSVIFPGNLRETRISSAAEAPEGETECADVEWTYEANVSYFKNSDKTSVIYLVIENNRNTKNFFLQMTIGSPVNFQFQNNCNFQPYNLYCGDNLLPTLDSLQIGDKTYYSVFEISKQSCTNPTLPIVYYTINEGVVGFKTTDNELWYLN